MLIGHYAPALLLKSRAPKLPLWVLFIGVEWLDYLWSAFVLVGLERMRVTPGINASNSLDLYDMPWSHSLVATVVWSLLVGAVIFWWLKDRGSAVAMALAVASHFALDLIVHVNDLPLAGAGTLKLGFGLWNHFTLALLLETGLFIAAALVLTFSPGWRRRRSWWLLAGGMTVACVVSFFVPTPGGPVQMALTGLALYVALPLLARRVDVTSGEAPPEFP